MTELVTSLAEGARVAEAARRAGRTVGFVPTMGALHEGHASLIARARAECDEVLVSIFVNPLQFGDPADLERYPRTVDADLAVAAAAGASVVVTPEVAELYPTWPAPPATLVTVGALAAHYEGASRPGHFDGVATVVTKLLSAIRADRAYFGEKDFQQLAIVRQLVADLWIETEVVPCPTSREPDGLARSSRNARLSPAARAAATCLADALVAAARAFAAQPSISGASLEATMARVLRAAGPEVVPDYAVVVDASTLEQVVGPIDPTTTRLLVATIVGGVRLLDNATVTEPPRDL